MQVFIFSAPVLWGHLRLAVCLRSLRSSRGGVPYVIFSFCVHVTAAFLHPFESRDGTAPGPLHHLLWFPYTLPTLLSGICLLNLLEFS